MSISSNNPGGGVSLEKHSPPTLIQNTLPVPNPHKAQGLSVSTVFRGVARHHLKQALGETYFAFFDGWGIIASVVQGGLDAFQQMDEASQGHHHRLAIEAIVKAVL